MTVPDQVETPPPFGGTWDAWVRALSASLAGLAPAARGIARAVRRRRPFLCVITPVFDPARASLEILIADLRRQTFGDFVHVMVSNGPSPEVAALYYDRVLPEFPIRFEHIDMANFTFSAAVAREHPYPIDHAPRSDRERLSVLGGDLLARRSLLERGVYASVKYQPVDASASTPSAHDFWTRALCLPLHQNLEPLYADYVMTRVVQVLAETSPAARGALDRVEGVR